MGADKTRGVTRWLDWQIRWVEARLNRQNGKRLAMGMVDISVVFALYYPISGEKPGVFFMSVLALTFGGMIAVLEETKNK